MEAGGNVAPSGDLFLKVIRGGGLIPSIDWPKPDLRAVLRHGLPQRGLSDEVNTWRTRNLRNLWRGARRVALAETLGLQHQYGALWLTILRASGEEVPLGLASMRVVTTAGVGYIVDAFQNSVELENMKYHGFGTGNTAEAVGDTALVTELTTQYATDNTRPTGSQTENGANVYRSVGTLSPDATVAITEHGLFSQAATGGGVLLDRTVFAAVNLVSGDSLQATFDHTQTAGG